jgi:hypothetical protein
VGSITMICEGPDCIRLLNNNERAAGNGDCYTTIRGETSQHVAVLDRSTGATLAMTGPAEDAESIASAHLFVAAPALLEAAKEALRQAEGQIIHPDLARALHALEAACVAAAPPKRTLQ